MAALNCNDIIVLFSAYSQPIKLKQTEIWKINSMKRLIHLELIDSEADGYGYCHVSDRGSCLIKHILNLKLPVAKYVMEEDKHG